MHTLSLIDRLVIGSCCWITPAVGERAACFAEPFGWAEAARIAGVLHDIGKLTADFQAYIRGERSSGGDHGTKSARWREGCGTREGGPGLQDQQGHAPAAQPQRGIAAAASAPYRSGLGLSFAMRSARSCSVFASIRSSSVRCIALNTSSRLAASNDRSACASALL